MVYLASQQALIIRSLLPEPWSYLVQSQVILLGLLLLPFPSCFQFAVGMI